MQYMDIILGSSIKLDPNNLSKNVLKEILDVLTVPNPQKKVAEREMLWEADKIPSHLKLFKYNGHNELVLPRGFLSHFKTILSGHNIYADIKDDRESDDNYFYDVPKISLRGYQNKAVADLIIAEQGIYKAMTGSGKTRAMLELARQCHQKTLIICEKNDIAVQWGNAARDFGFNLGCDLIVSLRQALWAQRGNIYTDWFDELGCVIVDECHHCSAETMFELVQRFTARYRFGCSATPDSDQDLFPIARAVIGPVVAHSTPEEIGDHLVIPSVKVVKTEFEFPYRPTLRLKNSRVQRNNYNSMMSKLEKDSNRNSLIMGLAVKEAEEGHYCLIVSKRKNHLEEIFNHFGEEEFWNDRIGWNKLTGDNSKEYKDIVEKIENRNKKYGYILFSTLADEGTDIPRLDRLFLAYPGRKLRGYEQSIGRIMRPHPQKKDAIIYDFRDANVSLLNSQFRDRAQNIYNKKKYKIENL